MAIRITDNEYLSYANRVNCNPCNNCKKVKCTCKQGKRGRDGKQGPRGHHGNTGDRGYQGFQGNQGPQGIQGDTGTQGNQGTQGYQGETGPQGIDGFQGLQGYQGETGFTGFQGLQGFQGVNGTAIQCGSEDPNCGMVPGQPNDIFISSEQGCIFIKDAGEIMTTAFTSVDGPILLPNVGTATPYPSIIKVCDLEGPISQIKVTLNGFTGDPSAIQALLVGPNSTTNVLLMSNDSHEVVANPPINISFSECADISITFSDFILPADGVFLPTLNTLYSGPSAIIAPYGTSMSAFNGLDPNGTWSLFINVPENTEIEGSITSWSLEITTGGWEPCACFLVAGRDVVMAQGYADNQTAVVVSSTMTLEFNPINPSDINRGGNWIIEEYVVPRTAIYRFHVELNYNFSTEAEGPHSLTISLMATGNKILGTHTVTYNGPVTVIRDVSPVQWLGELSKGQTVSVVASSNPDDGAWTLLFSGDDSDDPRSSLSIQEF